MIKIFALLFFLFAIVVRTQLSLARIDDIMDLSAVAKNFFSEEPNLKHENPSGEMINSFARSISDMWDESKSALYVLTRLAIYVDEKNDAGELSEAARVIRSFAERSEARKKVYMTKVEPSNSDLEMKAATGKGQVDLLASLIKQDANEDSLKFMAPEAKADLIIKILSLPTAQIHPNTAKWLFTMASSREDQLKLVKAIEKALEKRSDFGQEKTMNRSKNNLMAVFEEIESIRNREKINYFNEDVNANPNTARMTMNNVEKTARPNEQEKQIIQENIEEKSIKAQEEQKPTTDQEQQVNATQTSSNDKPKERNYFEEQDEKEREIEQIIYDNNKEPFYDNDGEYDDNEKRRDRVAQIVVMAIIGSIIAAAVGTYIYLRVRRARRNRTMLVVTEALETVA